MDIYEIGKLLKEEREKRGLSIEDVYKATKISIMNIEAIEKGKMDMLPHPVYTRGFIKSYAEFLKIDPLPLLEAYEENTSFVSEEITKEPQSSPLPVEDRGKGKLWFLLILLVVLIGLTILLFKIREHQMQQFNKKRSSILKEVPETSELKKKNIPMVTNNTQEKSTQKRKENNASISATTPIFKGTNNTTYPISSEKETNASNTSRPGILSNATLPSSKNATKSPEQSRQLHQVKVIAKDLCWMRGDIDNNSTKEVFLRKGQHTIFKFQNHMDLKLGNAGGVDIFLDGKPIPLKAKSGEVKTLHFPQKKNG